MQARLSFLVLFFSALLLSASPALSNGGSEPSDEGVSPRCEAAIDNAAGRYSKCLLKASAKDAKRGNEDRLLARQMRCEDKFNAQVARAQGYFGEERCTPYVSELAHRTVTYAEGAATEASGTASPSFLFMQNGTGGTLSDTTLTLTDVSSQTGYFSDRPYRIAGQMNTDEFIRLWDEGQTFAEDPPNADFSCTVDGDVVNYVVELTSPAMPGHDLSYSVTAVGETVLPETPVACDIESHLFVDGVLFVPHGPRMCVMYPEWYTCCVIEDAGAYTAINYQGVCTVDCTHSSAGCDCDMDYYECRTASCMNACPYDTVAECGC